MSDEEEPMEVAAEGAEGEEPAARLLLHSGSTSPHSGIRTTDLITPLSGSIHFMKSPSSIFPSRSQNAAHATSQHNSAL